MMTEEVVEESVVNRVGDLEEKIGRIGKSLEDVVNRLDSVEDKDLEVDELLESICATQEDIREILESFNKDVEEQEKRIEGLEEDVKEAFKKLKEMQEDLVEMKRLLESIKTGQGKDTEYLFKAIEEIRVIVEKNAEKEDKRFLKHTVVLSVLVTAVLGVDKVMSFLL